VGRPATYFERKGHNFKRRKSDNVDQDHNCSRGSPHPRRDCFRRTSEGFIRRSASDLVRHQSGMQWVGPKDGPLVQWPCRQCLWLRACAHTRLARAMILGRSLVNPGRKPWGFSGASASVLSVRMMSQQSADFRCWPALPHAISSQADAFAASRPATAFESLPERCPAELAARTRNTHPGGFLGHSLEKGPAIFSGKCVPLPT
jgi:hypothetical protein